MNHFIFSAALTSLATLALGFFVLVKKRKSILAKVFFLYCLAIAWWSFFVSFHTPHLSENLAPWMGKLLHLGAILIPVFFLHFTYVFLRIFEKKKGRLFLAYGISAVFLFLNFFTDLLIRGTSYREEYSFPTPSQTYLLFFLFFLTCVLASLWNLFRDFRRKTGIKRTQIAYLFVSSVFGYLGGMDNFLITIDLRLPLLYPYGLYAVILYVAVMTYAIVRYRLLEIEVIIKKTVVFAGLFGMVMTVVGVVTGLAQSYVGKLLHMNPTHLLILSVLLIVILYEPVKRFLVNWTDRYLFQKKEDIRLILKRLSENIVKILDLDQVARMILETFRDSLRAETGVILLKNETDYRTLNSFGLGWSQAVQTYRAEDPVIQYFRSHSEVLDLESEETYGRLPLLVSTALQNLGASVAIPLVLQEELIGLLTLGKKKSDEEYGREEMDYFPTVASQVAIALSNARLYGEAVEAKKKIEAMQLELIHREKMAFISDLVKGIAHEVFNPLLPIFYKIDELEKDIFLELYGLYKAQEEKLSPEERERFRQALRQHRAAVQTLDLNAKHIRLVIDTLNKMQKEDKETVGPMDLKIFLKDSRALIGMELHGEEREIPVEEDVPRGTPPIKGNPTLLAQVFVNLFKNSIHAMEHSKEKKIRIEAQTDPDDRKLLRIDFSDTGSGIPADILPRIFDFGFTTKGKQGQGIGLSQCKLIIEKFGGSITCRSKPGQGTTFTLRLPIWEEETHDKTSSRR